MVRLDDRERVRSDQHDVIAAAVRNWSGPTLQSFLICFHSARGQIEPKLAFESLEYVSSELKKQGATAVVAPPGSVCDPSLQKAAEQGSYIVIMGVIRL